MHALLASVLLSAAVTSPIARQVEFAHKVAGLKAQWAAQDLRVQKTQARANRAMQNAQEALATFEARKAAAKKAAEERRRRGPDL